ncbi:hypothetical protein AQZ52_05820 [Novosphingobium fuchskuhlense]|uniref:Membrane-anchored protein n=1 Tax=Novosphingobium fuchskuhlense TaxID=1117702 RepID=A0A117UXM7_9SPHN|nr:hypothetical protein [Novosphingobium fuchskuhlense]KUR72744.1 hypothetical protein AQZ52_05820 [Novosphingobium fuchskuhlense]
MNESRSADLCKVPAITLGFWIIKILATTFGETAGDTVSMSWLGETTATAGQGGLDGYLVGTAIFLSLLVGLVMAQIRARTFHPLLYWTTIIASTTAGTTMADFATRSIGIGYPGGSLLLLGMVLASLWIWYRAMGSINVADIHAPRAELFYWVTITMSQTLGTALGDWLADGPLGYLGAAAVFGAALSVLALLYWQTAISRVALFWAAFILTRPLGATVGDFLDKPMASGGLELSRAMASAVLIAAIILLVLFTPQRTSSRESPLAE